MGEFELGALTACLYLYETSVDQFVSDTSTRRLDDDDRLIRERQWIASPHRAIQLLSHDELQKLCAVMRERFLCRVERAVNRAPRVWRDRQDCPVFPAW